MVCNHGTKILVSTKLAEELFIGFARGISWS